jgi:hypothetical protein
VAKNERKHCDSHSFFFIAAAYLIAFSQPLGLVTLFFQSPTISSQGNSTAFVGSDYNVNIVASGVTNFYAYQFDINYNPGVLQFQGVSFSDILGNSSQQFCTDSSSWAISPGTVANVACTRIVSGGVTGTGNLAAVRFRVVGAGTSDNIISNVIVSNPSAQAMAVTLQSSTLTSTNPPTTNQSPVISNVYISSSSGAPCNAAKFAVATTTISSFTPGSDYLCVRIIVSDPNNNSEINLTSLQSLVAVWNPSSGSTEADAIAGHGWDHHPIRSFIDCSTLNPKTSFSSTDTQVCAQLPPATDLSSSTGIGVKDISGNAWNVKAFLQDTPATASPGTKLLGSSINVQSTTGLEISENGCSFTGQPGGKTALSCRISGNETMTVKHTGNVPMSIYTFMLRPFTSPSIINGTSFYWNDTRLTNPSSVNFSTGTRGQIGNTDSNVAIATSFDRGTNNIPSTKNVYMYISIPTNLQAGNYSGGVIAYTGVAG